MKHQSIEQDDSFLVQGIKSGFFNRAEYLAFYLVGHKPKTQIWQVENKHHGTVLGEIVWYSGWRQYVFNPEPTTTFNGGCLQDIVNFLETLNDIHYGRV